jgi:hypothetical protein
VIEERRQGAAGGVAAVDVDAATGPTGIVTREELQRESDRAAGIVRKAAAP